ncbi:hypothetical protein BJX65DRAFT_279851 [Aspergillus insuetus]
MVYYTCMTASCVSILFLRHFLGPLSLRASSHFLLFFPPFFSFLMGLFYICLVLTQRWRYAMQAPRQEWKHDVRWRVDMLTKRIHTCAFEGNWGRIWPLFSIC